MNLHLTGHHLEITPSIRDYLSSKLERITHHFDHVIDVNVILTVEKLQQKVEASIHVSGKDIFCESTIAPSSSTRKNPLSIATMAPPSSTNPASDTGMKADAHPRGPT